MLENRPEWSKVTSAGIFRVPAKGGRFDCHFHDKAKGHPVPAKALPEDFPT